MKNKMKIILAGLSIMFASATLAFANQPEPPGMGGDRIICHCTMFANCKVSGSSGVCAQSEPGGNIQCSVFNSNC